MSTVEKEHNGNVKSVLKAIAILEKLAEAGELSIGELSESLSMDKATVHRLVNTIKEAGYVVQNEETKKYSNGIKVFALGQQVIHRSGLRDIARPHMKRLAAITGETINLGVSVNNETIYIDRIDSPSIMKVGVKIGAGVPNYCTGMGKAILAFQREDEIERAIAAIAFEKYTKNTPGSEECLREQLAQIRKVGYALDEEEYVAGLVCLAAPVFDASGMPIAAVSISCPKLRYNWEEHGVRYSALIKDVAQKVSTQLGYQP